MPVYMVYVCHSVSDRAQMGRTCSAHGRPQRGFTSTCRLAGLFVDGNAL